MEQVTIDFSKATPGMKPLHAVNNGPVYKFAADQRITNMDAWQEAGIPYARTHDASFYATYGGEHTVDVANIFTNFDADPEDPASYDFTLTDEYLRVIEYSGTETFYRLGSKIEHWAKKYHTLPPKDFKKWAVICEHIIRHYTEGWAEGYHMKITYWEIWNEPDLDADDSTHKRTWGGTKATFFDLYEIAAKHLKSCFPHLKIGGPAIAGSREWGKDFLLEMKKRGTPIDFFSWHIYSNDPRKVADRASEWRKILDECGYPEAESILNEWNYVRGWLGDDWIYSLRSEKSIKGAAFIASTMQACQYVPLDMLMYYDARPCGMNGMFSTDLVCDCLKGYYPFKMYNTLYKMGASVPAKSENGDIFVSAAKGDGRFGIFLSHFNDNDETPKKEVALRLSGLSGKNFRVKYYLLDKENDMEPVKEELLSGKEATLFLSVPLFGTYLIEGEEF